MAGLPRACDWHHLNSGSAPRVPLNAAMGVAASRPLWSVEELDAMTAGKPMTAEQGATLSRLAEAAYERDAFKPNLTRGEAVLSENSIRPELAWWGRIVASSVAMLAILYARGMFVADLFKSRSRLEAENLFLRHQLNLALRQKPPRIRLRGSDRALLVWMARLWPSLLDTIQVVQPETILRWHRAGVRAFWRWKSRNRAGRPKIDRELRELIRRMSMQNSLWGASRIHGELLKLGYEVAQSTVSKYHRQSPIKKWWLLWGKERQTLNADYRMLFEECHSSDWL
jgi:hypothetical protein